MMGFVCQRFCHLVMIVEPTVPPSGQPSRKVPAKCAGGLGSISSLTNTKGLKIIEEKVLPLL